ncbi:MAG: ATP-binding cassette domain-containing protein [Saprospiraceae bacterium]|nr:ATP-binding cassette domain-containing protein [Saprospiraceae bacterium]
MSGILALEPNQTINISNDPKSVIEIVNLKKSFGSQEVIKNVSLKLFNGENLVVLGKSGTGKSVLIKCIVGLLNFDSGNISVFGKDISKLSLAELNKLREDIGFLFQSGALYDSMTVKQNLEFPLRRIKRNLSEKEISIKVETVLESVGLLDALHKRPSQLSGGMKKRISLARTIIVDPKIILYDEPTTGLDPETAFEISSLINKVKDQYKTSSIIITHDINCAKVTANRILMIKDGKVYKEGLLKEFEQSTDESIHSFFR